MNRFLVLFIVFSAVTACDAKPQIGESVQTCGDTRPEMCMELYQPVCALRDTSTRCVTTPCDSEQWADYSNACKACADISVSGFIDGACNTEPN